MTGFPHHPILRWLSCILLIFAFMMPLAAALDLGSAGSGSSTTPAIANGDTVRLTGIATGHPRLGLQVWVISKNYLKISTIPVNADNTFTFELKPADTRNLASGQYYVVVQHPMMNGQFDIYYDAGSGAVINRQTGTGGSKIFQMSGSGSLQGPDSAQALLNAISSQNVDDSFTTYTFFVSPPSAMISPVGDHAVGDTFTIGGSTNLAVGDQLLVEITSSSFAPTSKNQDSGFSAASGMVTVVPGSGGYNRWSFDVDASTFRPDEYIVKISGVTTEVTGTTMFNIVNRLPTTVTTIITTPPPTTRIPFTTIPPTPVPTTPQKSPLPLWVSLGACTFAAGLVLRIQKK